MRIEKLVYVCHEYGGDEHIFDKVTRLVTKLTHLNPNICFISPIHTFGFMYDEINYTRGLDFCLLLLSQCDEMWTFGKYSESQGCKIEKKHCEKYKIPIVDRGEYNII